MMYKRTTALTTGKLIKLQNCNHSTILKLKCVFSYTLFFLFGGYERSFIIMKVPPQFLFQGRERGKVCSCHLATFNRKEKHNTYTLKLFFLVHNVNFWVHLSKCDFDTQDSMIC